MPYFIWRHHRRSAYSTSFNGRDWIPSLEGRALDESSPHACSLSRRPVVHLAPRPEMLTHTFPPVHAPFGAGAGRREEGIRALQGNSEERTGVRV